MNVTSRALAAKRRATRPRRERDVQAAILAALRAMPGVVAWKTGGGLLPVGNRRVRMGHKGVSDIVGWVTEATCVRCGSLVTCSGCRAPGFTRHARFFACEVKAKGKAPTDEQRAFLDAVNAAGGIAIVAYDVESVLAALR